jgi:hypothetical protein
MCNLSNWRRGRRGRDSWIYNYLCNRMFVERHSTLLYLYVLYITKTLSNQHVSFTNTFKYETLKYQ